MTQIRKESLDFEAVLRRHGTVEQIKKFSRETLPDVKTHLTTMQHAIKTKDPQNLERLARILVDTLTDLSPPAALDLALLLVRQGRSGILTESPQTIELLKNAINRLQKTIATL